MTRRRGFTLVEVLVTSGLATIVLGTGVLMFLNGSKGFTRATQHSSIREQALLILERIGRDLDGLIVSQELNPRTNKFFMVQPFQLLELTEQPTMEKGVPSVRRFAKGLRFHVYHRTEMVRIENPNDPKERKETTEAPDAERNEPDDGSLRLPRVVGRYVEYKTVPSLDGRGVDLHRNGQKINQIPLAEVRFERGDPVHAVQTMGASPNAVLNILVVPRHGMEGQMDEATVRRQDEVGTALSRVVHLTAYESQYTALLGVALEKAKAKPPQPLDPVELAVLKDAKVWGFLEQADDKLTKTPIRYRLPDDLIHIEIDQPFETKARADSEFARAETRQGASVAAVMKRAGSAAGSGGGGRAGSGSSAGSASALAGAP